MRGTSVVDQNEVGDWLGIKPNEKVQRSKPIRSWVGDKGIILRVRNIKNVIRVSGSCVKATVFAPYGNETRTFIPNPQPCGEKPSIMRLSVVGDDFAAYPTTPTMRPVTCRGGNFAATQEIFARLGRDLGEAAATCGDDRTATQASRRKRTNRLVRGKTENA